MSKDKEARLERAVDFFGPYAPVLGAPRKPHPMTEAEIDYLACVIEAEGKPEEAYAWAARMRGMTFKAIGTALGLSPTRADNLYMAGRERIKNADRAYDWGTAGGHRLRATVGGIGVHLDLVQGRAEAAKEERRLTEEIDHLLSVVASMRERRAALRAKYGGPLNQREATR